jgi:hypothetical protein
MPEENVHICRHTGLLGLSLSFWTVEIGAVRLTFLFLSTPSQFKMSPRIPITIDANTINPAFNIHSIYVDGYHTHFHSTGNV